MDPRWEDIGKKLRCSPALVSGVFFALLEHSHETRKGVSGWHVGRYADWAGVDPGKIAQIVHVMRAWGVISDDALVVLSTKTDGTAAARARRYRARKRGSDAPRRRARSIQTGKVSVTLDRDVITPNRDFVTPNRDGVTPDRDATLSVTPNRDFVTPNRDGVTLNRDGEGGDIGGGEVLLSSSLCITQSKSTSTLRVNAPADALVDQMIEKLRSAGAVRSPASAMIARPQVQAWVAQGVTTDQLDAAIALCRQARISQGSEQPLNTGYVASKLATVLETVANAPAAPPPAAPGAAAERAGTSAVAAELASYEGWAARQVEFGQLSPDAAAARVAAERVRLGVSA